MLIGWIFGVTPRRHRRVLVRDFVRDGARRLGEREPAVGVVVEHTDVPGRQERIRTGPGLLRPIDELAAFLQAQVHVAFDGLAVLVRDERAHLGRRGHGRRAVLLRRDVALDEQSADLARDRLTALLLEVARDKEALRSLSRQWFERSEALAGNDAAIRALPRPSLSVLLDHFEHIIRVAGIDHVGLGSDFDGVGGLLPQGMDDVTRLPLVAQGLLDRGYSEADVKKVLGGNMLRVMERAIDRN